MASLEKATRVLYLLALAVQTSYAIGVCLGNCGNEIFSCQCGSQQGQIVQVSVEKCTFFYRWKPYCHASIDGDRVKAEDVCPKFQQCATCADDGGSCSSCPPGKYGTFCDRGQEIRSCSCINGGRCLVPGGPCMCPPGFQGKVCETKTGCPPLETSALLTVLRVPEENPRYVEFRCPSGYIMEGSVAANCLLETSQWDQPPPTCIPVCSMPDTPARGTILNAPLDTGLVKSGQYLEFQCENGTTLFGSRRITCTEERTWSHVPPICIQISSCGEPTSVFHSTYEQHTPPFQPPFSNGTRVVFSCHDGYLMFGQSQIVCGNDGQWSKDRPACIRVFDSEVDCGTSGLQVVEEVGTPVRIHCPPGCANANSSVWGTIIYEESSSLCKAAVHSGRITNALGGSVFVVNNGQYNDFLSSTLHGIESERKNGIAGSFRFHHDPDIDLQNQDNPDKGCPRGWTELQGHCIYAVTKRRAWGAARMICNNMGSRLPSLQDPAFIKEVLKSRGSDVESFWLLSKSNSNGSSTSLPLWEGLDLGLNPDVMALEVGDDLENALESDQTSCSLVSHSSSGALWTSKSCSESSPFICDIDLSQYLVTCEDLGQLENGLALLQDPERGLRRGAVMNFRCMDLHVIRGESSSTCLPDGTWSSPPPICQRIPACLNPPSVEFGSFGIQAPLPPASNSRIGFGPRTRGSRIGINQHSRSVRSFLQSENTIDLPAGYHRVGSRAVYSCEAKYYKLIGSKTRRCKKDGTWTGTPVTCYPVCGQSDTPRSPFIYRGNSSDIGQWPWQVGIAHIRDGNFLVCGASLISEYWVLTAAHCVVDELTLLPIEPEDIQLYAGKYYRDDIKNDDFVQIRKASEVRVHGNYDPSTYDSDLALVKMESPVKLTSRVQPVCLPTDRSTRWNMLDGRKGVVTGWGLTETEAYADTLRQAVLPVVTHEECEEGYKEAGLPLTVTENMFCAGLELGGTDSCSGDSGGPMVFQMDSGNNKHWVLEGIVSWGSLAGCGHRRQYGGFTKVYRFLDWIEQNM